MIRNVEIPRLGRGRMAAAGDQTVTSAEIISATAMDGSPLDSGPGLYTCDLGYTPGGCGGQTSTTNPGTTNTAAQAASTGNVYSPFGGLGLVTVPDFIAKYANAIIVALLVAGVLYVASQGKER